MITNIYLITSIAVVGGTLFGFDLSSMSAMYVKKRRMSFSIIDAELTLP